MNMLQQYKSTSEYCQTQAAEKRSHVNSVYKVSVFTGGRLK